MLPDQEEEKMGGACAGVGLWGLLVIKIIRRKASSVGARAGGKNSYVRWSR